MNQYKYLSIKEQEKILVLHTEKKSLHSIAKELKRPVSTISRALWRNVEKNQTYSAVEA